MDVQHKKNPFLCHLFLGRIYSVTQKTALSTISSVGEKHICNLTRFREYHTRNLICIVIFIYNSKTSV